MPQSEQQKNAWSIVHGIYRNPPVSAENKKRAWDTIHAAYSKNPILNPMTKNSKTITLMSEKVPDREQDMTVKPISAAREKKVVVVRPEVQAKSDKIYNLMFKLAKKDKTRDNVGEMEKLEKKIMDLSTEETRSQFPGVWENWYDLGKSDTGRVQKTEWSRYNMEHERKIRDDWDSRHPEESKRLKMWNFFSTEG